MDSIVFGESNSLKWSMKYNFILENGYFMDIYWVIIISKWLIVSYCIIYILGAKEKEEMDI